MKDEFKTGIDFIDEQHKKLFEIADRAYVLLKDQFTIDKYDKISEILSELQDYTAFHFNAEEKYMEKIGYNKLLSQKVAHNDFIDKLDNVDLKHIDENQEQAILDILEFLNNWLIEHIYHSDKLIGK
jgi:hemerythrin